MVRGERCSRGKGKRLISPNSIEYWWEKFQLPAFQMRADQIREFEKNAVECEEEESQIRI
jgi:hypothetical protein